MRVKKLELKDFKRFDDLTIDLGEEPKKIIALVGPNGCGKSSIFDAFEEKLRDFRNHGSEEPGFYSKAFYYADENKKVTTYQRKRSVILTTIPSELNRKGFYIRTSYRFTPKFDVQGISAMPEILQMNDEPISSITLDSRLETNYKRLLGASYSEFFLGKRTGDEVRAELIDSVNGILSKILDIEISDFGNIFEKRGQLYFNKENVENFPYSNLSSGEKEVVDIILDLVVKTKVYDDTVFCIDEPELHLNTAIQRKLLIEIEKLIPENCQLWVATHSIGFLRALQEELRDKSQILDFSEKNYFTGTCVINPIKTTRQNWQRIFNTALEDLTGLISPKRIIYCEGKYAPSSDGKERGFDANVYNNIFSEKHNDTVFVSSGGNTELDQRSEIALTILTKVFSDFEILVLKDRDVSSGKPNTEKERQLYLENNPKNFRLLRRFEIENYLFDKEVLKKYCVINQLQFEEEEYDKFVTNINDQNLKDGTSRIKNFCNITTSINPEKFKLNLSEVISQDMAVYLEMEDCIFGNSK